MGRGLAATLPPGVRVDEPGACVTLPPHGNWPAAQAAGRMWCGTQTPRQSQAYFGVGRTSRRCSCATRAARSCQCKLCPPRAIPASPGVVPAPCGRAPPPREGEQQPHARARPRPPPSYGSFNVDARRCPNGDAHHALHGIHMAMNGLLDTPANGGNPVVVALASSIADHRKKKATPWYVAAAGTCRAAGGRAAHATSAPLPSYPCCSPLPSPPCSPSSSSLRSLSGGGAELLKGPGGVDHPSDLQYEFILTVVAPAHRAASPQGQVRAPLPPHRATRRCPGPPAARCAADLAHPPAPRRRSTPTSWSG